MKKERDRDRQEKRESQRERERERERGLVIDSYRCELADTRVMRIYINSVIPSQFQICWSIELAFVAEELSRVRYIQRIDLHPLETLIAVLKVNDDTVYCYIPFQ